MNLKKKLRLRRISILCGTQLSNSGIKVGQRGLEMIPRMFRYLSSRVWGWKVLRKTSYTRVTLRIQTTKTEKGNCEGWGRTDLLLHSGSLYRRKNAVLRFLAHKPPDSFSDPGTPVLTLNHCRDPTSESLNNIIVCCVTHKFGSKHTKDNECLLGYRLTISSP